MSFVGSVVEVMLNVVTGVLQNCCAHRETMPMSFLAEIEPSAKVSRTRKVYHNKLGKEMD